jgi:hypothetical protein
MYGMYQALIDRMFLERYEDRPPDGAFHPSSLSTCHRKALYETSGTAPSDETAVRNIRIMGEGTDMHADIQARIHQEWPGFLSEVPVQWGPVKGSVDGLRLIEERPGYTADAGAEVPYSIYEVQEFKSGGNWKMRSVRKAPSEDHVKQARVYHWALRNMGFQLTDSVRIVYFGREDWDVVEHVVPAFSPEEADEFELGLVGLSVHLVEGTLPDRLPIVDGKKNWLCAGYCEYRTRCWDQDRENERG